MAIALAFACGLGAWVLFTILPNVYRPARWPVVIVAALMGALNGFQRFGDAPLTTEQVERELVESAEGGELARAFRQADPLAFDAYVAHVRSAMLEGDPNGQAMMQAGIAIQDAAEARISSAEDVTAYYELRRDELLEFRSTNPAACRYVFFGEGSGGPPPISQALLRRRQDLYVRAFGAVSATPPTPMSDTELRAALENVSAGVQAIAENDVDLLSAQTDESGREARACEVMAEYMNQLARSHEAPRIFVTLRQRPPRPA